MALHANAYVPIDIVILFILSYFEESWQCMKRHKKCTGTLLMPLLFLVLILLLGCSLLDVQ
jgi:hypothetical protein